jgi:GDPmannose 4,6-dehydratase
LDAPATAPENRHHCLRLCRYVKPAPALYRPAEVNLLQGDAAKARRVLGWRHRIGFEGLVREIVDAPWGML